MEQHTNTGILSAENISIGYNGKRTVTVAENISLTLKTGTLTALIGANGIGKSTLLRTLSGLQKPLAGEIAINGKSLYHHSPAEMAQKLALVLTDALPQGNLTVFELVALGRQPYTNWLGSLSAEDITMVNEALSLTDTLHLATKKHYEISDGQLQNVMIARALAQDTPLIILDEPTTHLDLTHKVNLLRLLKKLATEQGKCILFSTHDLELALQMADELVVMKKGSLTSGSTAQLLQDNTLTNLFDSPFITFDAERKSFIIKEA